MRILNRKRLAVGALVLLSFLLAGCQAQQPSGPIKILVPTSMTGGRSSVESLCMNGANMAVEDINGKGGVVGRQIELVTEDTTSTVPGAINAFNKLVGEHEDGVAVYGVIMSDFAIALDPYVAEEKIPFITGGSNDRITKLGNEWMFRIRPSDGTVARLLVEFAVNDLGLSKIAILHDTNEYGTGGKDSILAALRDLGLEPVAVEAHQTEDKDFSSQLLSIKNAGAEAMIGWQMIVEAALVTRQYKELGLENEFVLIGSPSYPPSQPAWGLSEGAANGIYSAQDIVFNEEAPQSVQEFAQRYKEKYDQDASLASANGYDFVQIMAAAIEKAKSTDREKVRQALEDLQFQGVMFNYAFDGTGESVFETVIVTIENDQVKIIKRLTF